MTSITTDWEEIINTYDNSQEVKFTDFINSEINKFDDLLGVYPSKENIFKCFSYFNIQETRVVILGQDPYHGPNQATGLCFDINDDCKYPPSLRNIEKVLGKKPNFDNWANQGVLLLNASLSVLQGKPGSHMKYWLPFTKEIISTINNKCSNVIFIVWGAFALKLVDENVDSTKHTVYVSSHPSPFSCRKKLRHYPAFIDSDIFNKISVIDW